MDDFNLNISETSYLNVPDRDKNPSEAESVNSSISDLSTLPISSRRRDYGVSCFFFKLIKTTNLIIIEFNR